MNVGEFKVKINVNNKVRVFLFHNEVTPYRLPIFDRLAQIVDLHVYFSRNKSPERLWSDSLENYSFKGRILMNSTLSFGRTCIVINWSLPFVLFKTRYDVYIVAENTENIFSIGIIYFVAKILRRPFILWSGMTDVMYPQLLRYHIWSNAKRVLLKIPRIFFYKFAHSLIVYGKCTKLYLRRYGIKDDKIFAGTQIVPKSQLPKIHGCKKTTKFPEKKVVLCICYLSERKGVNYLIKAFKALRRKDVILIIGGVGKEEKRLKYLAKGNKNIHFAGYMDGEEKARYYSIADIFVLPTLHDPWGLVINEAMYYGLPIITTDAAGCSQELIRGNGIVVKAGDEKELFLALKKLLDNENLRKRMGKRSKEIIKTYNVSYAVNTFIQAIEYALKNSKTGIT